MRAALRAFLRRASPVRWWRRSLQFRVVALTLLLSLTVVALLGLLLLDRIGRGLLEDKRRAALVEVGSGLFDAQTKLSQADRTDPASTDSLLQQITGELGTRGSPAGMSDVAMLPGRTDGGGYVVGPARLAEDIPPALRTEVRDKSVEAETYVTIRRDGPNVRALVIGAPLTAATGETYELYYVFPLTSEQKTLHLVRATLEAAGGALVLLLAAVAALVTRQVVTPVRMAARVAGRLAAGNLEQRLTVRGEDDVARLAASFNGMARALQRQIAQLEELSRVQRRFTADVSHELRTPLTTVRMAADLLYDARSAFPPAAARSAELLHAELDRFEALLVDLLEISRYDAGVAVLEPEPVDLADVVREVVADEAARAARQGCMLDLSGVPDTPVVAEVDPRRVRRALRNLVENAVEHGEGRPVEIVLAADEAAVAVRVRDHGVGLSAEDCSRVFQRFWRADPSRTRVTGGTGLGLSIAFEDVRLHGGRLQAWGERGRGAAFRLALPRRVGERLRAAPLPLVPPDGRVVPSRRSDLVASDR